MHYLAKEIKDEFGLTCSVSAVCLAGPGAVVMLFLIKISVTQALLYLGHSECLYLVLLVFSARYRPAENKSKTHFFQKTQI